MIVDTHCHLDFPEFKDDLDEVLSRAKDSNVKYIINVSSSIEGSRKACELVDKYPFIFATCGIHPHHASGATDDSFREIEALAKSNKKIVAIGEVGLDFYRNLSSRVSQESMFIKFLEIKKRLNLPVIVHSRDAQKEILDILKKEDNVPINGVMHCFSGDKDFLKEILDLGLHVSFTCNITFKNAHKLREIVKYVPLDRLLLETDAPFLAPQEHRGKRNEPAYLIYLVEALASILNVTKERIEEITTDSANGLFKLGIKK